MKRLVVRSASISGYAELARTLGLDPAKLARRVGLSLRSLSSPDVQIPACKAYRLLEMSAALSGVDDFGLRLATKRGLSHLGALGMLVRDEPDVRSALKRMIASMNLHSTCVALDLQEHRDVAVAGVTVLADGEPVIRQSVEAAVGLLFQLLRNLLGTAWRPDGVQFVHAVGATDRPHRLLFGCPVRFSTDRNAVVFGATELDSFVPGSDRGFRAYSGIPAQSALPVGGKATAERVRQSILLLMPRGECTSQTVAQSLGMNRRTLHRHLSEGGTGFSSLLSSVRLTLAEQYLRAGLLRMTDISSLLGFNSLSSFSRWFVAHTGRAPTAWRRTK